MSNTDIEIEMALDKISEQIVRMCSQFEKVTGHPITSINLFRDQNGNLGCETEISITGCMVLMKRGDLDS